MILNHPRSRSQNILIKYLEYEDRYNVGLKRGSDRKSSVDFRLAVCTLILDDLELAYFKVIKIARQLLRKMQKW